MNKVEIPYYLGVFALLFLDRWYDYITIIITKE